MSYKYIIILFVLVFFACKDEKFTNKKAIWITNAFATLESGNYPNIKAVSWWHENFDNSLLKINSSQESLDAYEKSVSSPIFVTNPNFADKKLLTSPKGIYHAAYPDFGGTEDVVTKDKITEFELLAGKKIVWAYFSNNWYNKISFPLTSVNIIHSAGKIPFIRIMPRTNFAENVADTNYTMQKIIDGVFDDELTQWAKDAANTGIPLLAEFGTEVNGNWFPWNGQYNGGGETTKYGDFNFPDGPERFRDAYRHIIDICRKNNANNITWFFHIDAYGEPEEQWNIPENYYPGDDYIDWLGVSIYGPQENNEDYQEFSEILNDIYPELCSISDKPIAILEFAITEIK
jgi:beta-mannanase